MDFSYRIKSTYDLLLMAERLQSLTGSFNNFDHFYNSKLRESIDKKVRKGNQEKLVLNKPGRASFSILYIHGYGASRAEGEYVMDRIASDLGANIYYLRLPGHGTSIEDHSLTSASDLLACAAEALFIAGDIGERVIISGSSMGGLIGTILSALYPDNVQGLMLASPFYEFSSYNARLLHLPGMLDLISRLRPLRIIDDPVSDEVDNWTMYWYKQQYLSSLSMLIDLVKTIRSGHLLKHVNVPALMLYYYLNRKVQDSTASVKHMLTAFNSFSSTCTRSTINRAISFAPGDHVLLSKYFPSPKEEIIESILDFCTSI